MLVLVLTHLVVGQIGAVSLARTRFTTAATAATAAIDENAFFTRHEQELTGVQQIQAVPEHHPSEEENPAATALFEDPTETAELIAAAEQAGYDRRHALT